MQLILVHAATQLCQDESDVDLILQSLPRLCNKMSLPIDIVDAQKKRKRETDNLLRERKKLEATPSSTSSASTSSSSRTPMSSPSSSASTSSPTSSASTSLSQTFDPTPSTLPSLGSMILVPSSTFKSLCTHACGHKGCKGLLKITGETYSSVQIVVKLSCEKCGKKSEEVNFSNKERKEFHLRIRLACMASGMSYDKQRRYLTNLGLSNWCSSTTFDRQLENKMVLLENYLEEAATRSCEKWMRLIIAEAKECGSDCIQLSFDNS